MLKFLHLEDYRCFKDTKLEFKDLTIAVGKNNAGKSTIIEALRIISYALSKPTFKIFLRVWFLIFLEKLNVLLSMVRC